MQNQAWPFLVSRNKVLGYQTVVSPGFLIDRGAADLLACAVEAEFDDAEAGEPICTQLPETSVGPLTLFYRVSRAAEKGRVLRDSAGRPVLRFDGVVMNGLKARSDVPERWLDSAERVVEPSFKRFWKSRERIGPVRSDGVAPEEIPADNPRRVSGAQDHHDRPVTPTKTVDATENSVSAGGRTGGPLRAWTLHARLLAAFLAGAIVGGGLVYLAGDGKAHEDGPQFECTAPTQASGNDGLIRWSGLADCQGLYE